MKNKISNLLSFFGYGNKKESKKEVAEINLNDVLEIKEVNGTTILNFKSHLLINTDKHIVFNSGGSMIVNSREKLYLCPELDFNNLVKENPDARELVNIAHNDYLNKSNLVFSKSSKLLNEINKPH